MSKIETLNLKIKNPVFPVEILVPGSKSESNRLLILDSLFQNHFILKNLSNADDTRLLQKALTQKSAFIDIHHAGTAMRFLTAYFSIIENSDVVISGSERMKQRPIGILVDALRSLGAEIDFLEEKGFPPLRIKGKHLTNHRLKLNAGVSSQFVSALMLIGPKLKNGLEIELEGKITSKPYIEMTAEVLRRIGAGVVIEDDFIRIEPLTKPIISSYEIESDYSSASYFYSFAALSENPDIRMKNFRKDSIQGDRKVVDIFRKHFGLETFFEKNFIRLKKIPDFKFKTFELDLNDTPDLAQTIAVTAAGLNIKCKLNGLHTLKIKETDRLLALHAELKKVGAETVIDDDSIELNSFFEADEIPVIKTYDDHRMAMSFAPLCAIRELQIENPDVVEKSFPGFWDEMAKF